MIRVRHFVLSPSYAATADGRIFRIKTGKVLKPAASKRGGYLIVSLWENCVGKTWPVHQIVCHAFHGNKPTQEHQVAHKDGDNTNNHETNLRWATKIENERDKIVHGKTNRGERNGSAKITDKQAEEIIHLSKTFPRSSGGKHIKKGTLQNVAKKYGITPNMVWQIVNGYRRTA